MADIDLSEAKRRMQARLPQSVSFGVEAEIAACIGQLMKPSTNGLSVGDRYSLGLHRYGRSIQYSSTFHYDADGTGRNSRPGGSVVDGSEYGVSALMGLIIVVSVVLVTVSCWLMPSTRNVLMVRISMRRLHSRAIGFVPF